MKKTPVKPVVAYAWLCDFGLCKWAEPDGRRLTEKGKPSSEARVVRVYLSIVPRKAVRRPR